MDPHKHRPPLKTYSKHLLQDSYKPPEKRQRIESRDSILRLTDCKATLSTSSQPKKRSIVDFFRPSQSSSPLTPRFSTFAHTPLEDELHTSLSTPPSYITSQSLRSSKKRRRRRLNTRPSLKVFEMAGERSSSGGNHHESSGNGTGSPHSPSSNSSSAGNAEFLTGSDGGVGPSLPTITVPSIAGRDISDFSTSTYASMASTGESPTDPNFDDDDDSTLVGTEASDVTSVNIMGDVTTAPGPGESLIAMGLNNGSTGDLNSSTIAEVGSSGDNFAGIPTSLRLSAPLALFRTPGQEESVVTIDIPNAYPHIASVPGSATSPSTGSNTIFGMSLNTSSGADNSTSSDSNTNSESVAIGADGDLSADNSTLSVINVSTSSSGSHGPTIASTATGSSISPTSVPAVAASISNANDGPVGSTSSILNGTNAADVANGAAASQFNVPAAAIVIFTGHGPVLNHLNSGIQATGSMVQTQLDLGVPTQVNCPQCRFTYNRTVAEDCLLHQRYHDAFLLGVPVGSLQPTPSQLVRQFWPNSPSGGDYIVMVDVASSPGWKDLAVKVLNIHVDKDLGAPKTMEYHLWSMMPDPEMANTGESNRVAMFKVYLYVKDFGPGAAKRVVSLLLAERITRAFESQRVQIRADEFGAFPSIVPNFQLEVSEKAQDAIMGVNKLWTHKTQRRKGYAKWLLGTARSTFIWGYRVPLTHVAWTHTTHDGARFAEYYLGIDAGDTFLTYIEDP